MEHPGLLEEAVHEAKVEMSRKCGGGAADAGMAEGSEAVSVYSTKLYSKESCGG